MTATDAPAARTAPRTFAEAEALLASSLPGYTPRRHQQELAAVIEESMARRGILFAQAGTGTGKSLAALIPSILWALSRGQRVVVATATKALQAQYATKDLPFLTEHLGVDFKWAVIKGRSNYPCAQKIADLAPGTATPGQVAVIDAVRATEGMDALDDVQLDGKNVKISESREYLDRDQLPRTTDTEWNQLSMSSSECPGARDCPFAKKGMCFAQRAKAKAAEADIVITNLAYLAVDMMLRASSGAQVDLLGQFGQLVIDEAHNLDDAITSALSDRLAQGSVNRLAGDVMAWLNENQGDWKPAQAVGHFAQQLWTKLEQIYSLWQRKQREDRNRDAKDMLLNERIRTELSDELASIGEALMQMWNVVRRTDPSTDRAERIQRRLDRRIGTMIERFRSLAMDADDVTVRWAEKEDERLYVRMVPVSPAPFLREHLWGQIPTVMMSATLATGRNYDGSADFTYMVDLLGLDRGYQPKVFEAGSTFNYAQQAMLYVPDKGQPVPSGATAAQWRTYAQQAMRHLVDASGGGALLLFTSRSAMEDAYGRLSTDLRMQGLEVMKQGDLPTAELVRRFKEDGNAVLFALRTFFEGIDIPGEALRLVVIDKLPFPVPTDLQFAARCDLVNRRAGKDVSFGKISMPVMTLPLIQATGRLIRTNDDRGVIAILDSRLSSKGYGAQIIRSLPPARVTTDIRQAAQFIQATR